MRYADFADTVTCLMPYPESASVWQAQEAEDLARARAEVEATLKGQRKNFARELPRGYDPKYVEAAL